jgi:hypothetical protein
MSLQQQKKFKKPVKFQYSNYTNTTNHHQSYVQSTSFVAQALAVDQELVVAQQRHHHNQHSHSQLVEQHRDKLVADRHLDIAVASVVVEDFAAVVGILRIQTIFFFLKNSLIIYIITTISFHFYNYVNLMFNISKK